MRSAMALERQCLKRACVPTILACGPSRYVSEVFRNLVEAVQALHDAGFIHRDLKPGRQRRRCPPQSVSTPRSLVVLRRCVCQRTFCSSAGIPKLRTW